MAIYTRHDARANEIAGWLPESGGFRVVANLVEKAQADVVVVDGLDLDEIPMHGAPVVWIQPDLPVEPGCWLPGVHACLRSDVTAEELQVSVMAAAGNLTVLTWEQAERLLPRVREPLFEHLTPREEQVLRLMADGFANKEIAARLQISVHTAKFHVAQVLAKLGVASRAEAVSSAIRRGLVPI